jgi:hypothetical protein
MTSKQIDRRQSLSYKDFVREYLRPHRPVIIPDGLQQWRALNRWNPAFFKEQYGAKEISIDAKTYSMSDFIELIENSTSTKPAPYLRNYILEKLSSDLLQDISPLPKYMFPNWFRGPSYPTEGSKAELYIGAAGGSFPSIHYDFNFTHAFICEIYGKKEFILYPHSQKQLMYPVQGAKRNMSMISDPDNPDLAKFPLFSKAVPIKTYLDPGELLFIPGGWWHTARMVTDAISISVNTANASNWANVTRDICNRARYRNPLLVIPAGTYLVGIGIVRFLQDLLSNI